MQIEKFEINGHEYIVTPHDGIEGIPIMAELAAIMSEPLLNMLKTQALQGGDGNVAALLENMNTAELGRNLRESLYRLADRPQIVQSLFARTVRDGQQLSNSAAFRMAYQGQWGEMLQALAQIVKVNGFIPF